jgi:predicted DNA-binding transcriptional regulator YafY
MIDECSDVLGQPVSERQIREDLMNMKKAFPEGYGADIRNRRPRDYYYFDRNFSIDNLTLTADEVDALEFAGKLLEQFRGMEPFDQIPGAMQKIFNHVRIRREMDEHQHGEYIIFEKVSAIKGLEFIEPLARAIRTKVVVTLIYRAYNRPRAYPQTIHPYLLKEYRNRWYIFGYNDYHEDLSLYSLDRVEKLEYDYAKDYKPCERPPKEYFENVIGVTRFAGTEPLQIRLKFTAHQAPYVLGQPLHASQQVVEQNDEYTIITLNVHESPELDIILLGWNKEVEVLEPEGYREKIRGLVEGAARNYQDTLTAKNK